MTGQALRGQLLVATPTLADGPFYRSVIVVLDHSPEGALGVILNRPGQADLRDVVGAVGDLASAPAVLFAGGPVDTGTAIALGTVRPGSPEVGWRPLVAPLVTVDLDADPEALGNVLSDLRVFAGYSGWSAGQLDAEVGSGAWYVVDRWPEDTFAASPDGMWSRVLRRQRWPLSAVASFPRDPGMN